MPARCNPIAPFLLRCALGITFVWAGMGKVASDVSVSGTKAARLANWGVLATGANGSSIPGDSTTSPNDRPVPKEPNGGRSETGNPGDVRIVADNGGFSIIMANQTVSEYTASDFPTEVKARKVYGVALMLHAAANPRPNEDGKTPFPLWPAFAAQGQWPVYFAWAVAITELVGGGLLLVGLMTRTAALGITGTMLGAVWLSEVGPAMQAGTTILGFIPEHAGGYDVALAPNGYVTLLWQMSLLAMALSLTMLGAGGLSLDGAMGGKPAGPKPGPKPPPANAGA